MFNFFSYLKKQILSHKKLFIFSVLFLGIALRIYFCTLGSNYDFRSYQIVTDIMNNGGSVYNDTLRYNYGPIWFNVLYILFKISSIFPDHQTAFRFAVTIFLTFIDVGLFFILYKKFRLLAATLFFLNPVSILVTGFNNQFDNFALILGFISIIIYDEKDENSLNKKNLLSLFILGLSITTKHILLLFPIWLAIRQKTLRGKILNLVIPLLVFLLSFVPYMFTSMNGIIQDVFLYHSADRAPFINAIIPGIINPYFPHLLFFLLTVIFFGFVFRKRNLMDGFLFYTIVLVIFSSGMFANYMSIVIPAISIFPNIWFGIFTLFGAFICMLDELGLNIYPIVSWTYEPWFYQFSPDKRFDVPIFFLFFGFIWIFYKKQILSRVKSFGKFVKEELLFQHETINS